MEILVFYFDSSLIRMTLSNPFLGYYIIILIPNKIRENFIDINDQPNIFPC